MVTLRKTFLSCIAVFSLGTTNAIAATYYVKPTGNDSAAGTSNATAWKTVNRVNGFSFQPGDDVYFLAGGEWPGQQLIVDWSGTETNRAVVGSYYIANGKERIGVPAGTARPTLVGGYPRMQEDGAVPSSPWSGLIRVTANYVTVQNMLVYKSSGAGIVLSNDFHHAIFENNEVEISAGSSILFYRGTHDNIMRGNDTSYCAQGWADGEPWRSKIDKTWPICNGAVGSSNNLIEKNYVHESYGEGIISWGGNKNIIRDNLIVWVRAVNIYIDNAADNIVERNVVIGNGGNGKFQRGTSGYPTYTAPAIAVACEAYATMSNAVRNVIRNNLVAGAGSCFYLAMKQGAIDGGYLVGGEFIGNTCVGTYSSFDNWAPVANIDRVLVANNLFYDAEEGAAACGNPTTSKVTFQNNLWGVTQSDAECRSSGDVIGNPLLSRSSDWRTGGPTNIFEALDFRPGDPALAKGVALSNLIHDYFGTPRPNKPSIGALEKSGTKVNTPSGLKLTITP